ncbi:MAG: hypothetical protein KC464_04580, partial [Myxococcales bacterium]|nr:hypothetical protein [Myxococcales bacterium]
HRVVVTDGGGAAPVTITDLDAPVSVALGADGRIHVADRGTCTVAVYAADGAPLARLGGYGRADGQLVAPRCVRLDGDGNVHVADLAAACVHVFDARHRFVARHQPTLADGRPAVALWLSDHPDGTVVPTLAARPG